VIAWLMPTGNNVRCLLKANRPTIKKSALARIDPMNGKKSNDSAIVP
jgi:hypothetical protein